MRTYNTSDTSIRLLLDNLITSSDPEAYRSTFYQIGKKLGEELKKKINNDSIPVALACTSEDADWLAKGILDTLNLDVDLCVYWSDRLKFGQDADGKELEYSNIVKSYEEIDDRSKTLIITKSIISSSCVVRSQIMRLVSKYKFDKIYIVAPVMYKDAEHNLRHDFPDNICQLFEFVSFAIDNDLNEKTGWVEPGIGGSVYERLNVDPRLYYPQIIDSRM